MIGRDELGQIKQNETVQTIAICTVFCFRAIVDYRINTPDEYQYSDGGLNDFSSSLMPPVLARNRPKKPPQAPPTM